MSKNGKYLLRSNKPDAFSIYDNLTGDYISSIFPIKIESETVYPIYGCFIDNTEDRVLIVARYDGSFPQKSMFCEFNIESELINYVFVATHRHRIFKAILNADETISVFFNGIEKVLLSEKFEDISK